MKEMLHPLSQSDNPKRSSSRIDPKNFYMYPQKTTTLDLSPQENPCVLQSRDQAQVTRLLNSCTTHSTLIGETSAPPYEMYDPLLDMEDAGELSNEMTRGCGVFEMVLPDGTYE
jgi:hypothetical protein